MPCFPQMGRIARRLARKLIEVRGDEPQYRFAKKLGISKSSLNRIEMEYQNVSLKTLETICRRLKCDIRDLFPPDE